jgi:hypothetical protein
VRVEAELGGLRNGRTRERQRLVTLLFLLAGYGPKDGGTWSGDEGDVGKVGRVDGSRKVAGEGKPCRRALHI